MYENEVKSGEKIIVNGRGVIPSSEVYVRPLPSFAINAGPAGLGNYMASSVSGVSDLTKALIAILAGTSAGYKINYLTKQYATASPYAAAALLAAGGVGSAGTAYAARRILDRMKADNEKPTGRS